jgi:tRNA (cmo5U34)-methyltransferase
MQTQIDHVQPGNKWQFDGDVAACFDDMLARSIPQYDVMRAAVTDVAARYVQPNTHIVDIGCSRGEALAPLLDRFGAANRFMGLDVSDPMIQAAKDRFKGWIDNGVVNVWKHDLRNGLPPNVLPSVVLSVLTLQFTPIEYRQKIVRSVYKRLRPGGAFILVEKILGECADLDDLMVEIYYAMKHANGYTADDIARKRMSLEGVLVPVTAKWNEQLLQSAGFCEVDCFWRWMNFAGWVAVKGEA